MLNTGHPAGSWYRATVVTPPARPRLEGDLDVEVGIVGGGYTGVEVAGQLHDLVSEAKEFYVHLRDTAVRVVLVHSRDHLSDSGE